MQKRNDLTEFDLGWLVGILEADGCFSHSTSPWGTVTPVVAVGMTDRDTVAQVADLMQTNVLGPYSQPGNRKPVWLAKINAFQAQSLMRLVEPYMSLRRKEAIAKIIGDQQDGMDFYDDLSLVSRETSDADTG